jgi:hypothetical protein
LFAADFSRFLLKRAKLAPATGLKYAQKAADLSRYVARRRTVRNRRFAACRDCANCLLQFAGVVHLRTAPSGKSLIAAEVPCCKAPFTVHFG